MASLDKRSVREEFDKIKADLDQLAKDGKVSTEVGLVIRSLFTLFDIILAIFMEKSTKKTKANSGIPSSQSDPDDTSTDPNNNGQSSKKRKLDKGSTSSKRERTHQRTITVKSCGHCGEDLSGQEAENVETRTLIDIVFEKTTYHVSAEVKTCPSCTSVNKGRFPKALQGSLQYGKGLKAYLLNLLIVHMVALNRVQQLAYAMVGQMISEATILKYALQLHVALERWEEQETERIIQQKVINTDETSLKVDKRKHWIHVYSSGDTVLKFLHPKRGKEAIEDINIIPLFHETIVHDSFASYLSYEHCQHGLCGSHILRELTFIVESNQYRWAINMKRLLKKTCKSVAKRKDKQLSQVEYNKLQKNYRNILTRGEKEMPTVPAKPKGQRGKMAKSDAHNLLERLQNYEQAILLFAKVAEVPFTNNRAERDLRMSKVKQKVSGCFRTETYAKAYCRISSYIQTMANKGYNPMAAIEMALSGEIYTGEV